MIERRSAMERPDMEAPKEEEKDGMPMPEENPDIQGPDFIVVATEGALKKLREEIARAENPATVYSPGEKKLSEYDLENKRRKLKSLSAYLEKHRRILAMSRLIDERNQNAEDEP